MQGSETLTAPVQSKQNLNIAPLSKWLKDAGLTERDL